MKYFATRLSENISETPEKFLLCVAVPIARTGSQDYGPGETPLEVGEDGIVKINRSEKEVFDSATLASFEGKPVTIEHPEEFVNPDNFSSLAHGHIQNVRRGEGENRNDIIADILIQSSRAISLVKAGMRGLSCGYEAEYVDKGVGHGEQTKIRGNHLALVDEGRAGDKYAIHDHKGDSMHKKVKDALKDMFAKITKTVDEFPEKKDEPKKESKDADYIADIKSMCDALIGKLEEMGKSKDAEEKPAVPEAKDDPVAGALEEKLKSMEAMLAKIMEKMSMGADEKSDEDGDKGDAGDEDKEDAEDEKEKQELVGDAKSRAEILVPGGEFATAKDAVTAFYKTTDGKKVIDTLTGGTPDFEKESDRLLVSASEMMKAKRRSDLKGTRVIDKGVQDFQSSIFANDKTMTPDKINEIHNNFYKKN